MDRIILADVKHCQNDDNYFVFEELLNSIMLFWSRDEWFADKLDSVNQLGVHRINSISTDLKLGKGTAYTWLFIM